MKKLEVNLRDLLIYDYLGLGITKEYSKNIKEELIIKFETLKKAAKLMNINYRTLLEIENRCTKIHIWKKIFKGLGKSINYLEPHIIKIVDKEPYNIRLPYKISPLHVTSSPH